jgi:DNA topoisomerase-1
VPSAAASFNHDGALVIVESPAKCRTIEKILGKRFQVMASMGHVMDLPKTKMGIDLERNFEPQYIVLPAKRKVLAQLKKAVREAGDLYLACDPDREGEAISWHLMNQLGSKKRVHRVRFNEITREGLEAAFRHPSAIDMNLVGAQQARRILDRIVGYSLSPLLWKKVAKGLSAGRVQSVALRVIVEREKKIRAFVPQEYWTIEAELMAAKGDRKSFRATLEKKGTEPVEIKDKAAADRLTAEIRPQPFRVGEVRKSIKKRSPQAPFTTSKLQQEAYNRLRYQPSRTMRIAQGLYEGVDLGDGETVGLITYMRTDSVTVSQTALAEVRKYIGQTFGAPYLPAEPHVYRAKKSAQEAHEAIRPTSVHRTPEKMRAYLSEEQAALYSLIWAKFVASQMKPALIRQSSVDIAAGPYLFKATGAEVEFPGFLRVLEERDEEDANVLPALERGEALELLKLEGSQHFTKPPARFTDASLVKLLEEEGIGRPSTYAPIIETLLERHYVERQGGALVPTELGFLIVGLLVLHFQKLMDVKFTAQMEADLDRVEEGRKRSTELLREFYREFSQLLERAQGAMKEIKKVEVKTDEFCDLCKKPLVVKWGRRGKFLSCSAFPACRFSKSIPTSFRCPQCGKGHLVARKARSGRGRKFYGCTEYPNCNYIAHKLPAPARPEAAAT